MIERFRRYMRSRSLRRGVDIYSAMKAWGSPFPVEVVIIDKPYLNAIGWCPEYNYDRKNIYFNVSTEIFSRFRKEKTKAEFPHLGESYSFSNRELWKSLNKRRMSLKEYSYYIYSHECAHKFLSIHHLNFAYHCLAFAIVNSVLLIRLKLDME